MRPWHAPRGEPKPPPEIWAEMEAAGKTGDEVRLGLARVKYREWLADREHRALPLPPPPDE